jgi:2'-5' RNA ligase
LFGSELSPPKPSVAMSRNTNRRKATDRFFFAIQPDAHAIERSCEIAGRLCVDHRLSGIPFRPWRLHLSLERFKDCVGVPADILRQANAIASMIRVPEFRIRLNRVTTLGFPGKPKRPIVLAATEEIPELTSLMRMLVTRIRGISTAPVFTPHMTLLYDKRIIDDIAVEAVTWTAREFVLIHNVLGTGQRYEILGRWPLLRRD